MSEVKLTKNALRAQRTRLKQLEKYLPTLQLKKAMLQSEVNDVRIEIENLEEDFHQIRLVASRSAGLLSEPIGVKFQDAARVSEIERNYENVAGVEIPLLDRVVFVPFEYSLFSTPPWLDGMVKQLRDVATAKARLVIAEEKKEALERELRQVSIRVNLFEKNLIPRSKTNIKKIKVFLGDQELAAVGQAKVAKTKILERKLLAKKKGGLSHEN
ncbi:MAG: V-type ATP synthase subunit D [Chlamydiia bacterium]|nr:V-type ATP synthase subunit D [Chlamydiia bacterium]